MTPLRRFAIAVGAALMLAGCGQKEPLRIGFIGELTGSQADLAEAARNGATLAIEEYKSSGRSPGRDIELIVRDTSDNPETARANVRELINAKVVAIIGPLSSSMTDAVKPVTDAAKVVLISPTITALKFSGQDDYLFRMNRTTRESGRLYAQRLAAKGFTRVAIAANTNNKVYTESWLTQFRLAYEPLGGSVAASAYFDSAADSHRDLIDSLLASKADALVFIATAGDAARLAQQTRKVNAAVPLFSAEWGGTDQLIELGGRSVEGLTVLQQFDRNDDSPRFAAFRDHYAKRYGREPLFGSVLAHDAATVLLTALSRRAPTMPLKEALIKLGPFAGLQQSIQFDATGDTNPKAYFTVIHNGRFVPAQ